MAVEFTDTLGTKSYDDIVEDTLQAVVDKDVGITNTSDGSVIRAIVEALAENDDEINYWLEYLYRAINVDALASDDPSIINTDLDRAAVIFGLIREPAKSAVGSVTFYTGDSPADYDIDIPYGYIVSTAPDADGNVIEWKVVSTDAKILTGEYSGVADVECTTDGEITMNVGAICVMPSSLQGIDHISNDTTISGGSNIESDASFLERIHTVKESMGMCTDEAIEQAVSQIEGVTRAIVRDRYDGIGTTGIIITTDQVPAPQSVVDEVTRIVNETKASGIRPIIVYTNYKIVDINITITPASAVDNTKIIEAIEDYTGALSAGDVFIIAQMERKILNALDTTLTHDDFTDIITNAPTTNVTTTEDQTVQAGDIYVNGEKIN